MAEKKEKETRPYSPEQLVEVSVRIAAALERIADRLDEWDKCITVAEFPGGGTAVRVKDIG